MKTYYEDFRLDYFFKESLIETSEQRCNIFQLCEIYFKMYDLYFILTVDFEIQHHHGQQIKSHQSASDPQRLKVPTSQTLSNERRLGWAGSDWLRFAGPRCLESGPGPGLGFLFVIALTQNQARICGHRATSQLLTLPTPCSCHALLYSEILLGLYVCVLKYFRS